MSKKYYWLKLQRDFFKRHDIQLLESMPDNGKDYVLFYLKLLCESIDHEGRLRFSDKIPYNEFMLSKITDTNIDVVKAAMNIFREMDLIELLDDGTYYMPKIQGMIGSESEWAVKKRAYRDNVQPSGGQLEDKMRTTRGQHEDNSRTKRGQSEDNVLKMSSKNEDIVRDNVRQEIEIEKDIEISKYSNNKINKYNRGGILDNINIYKGQIVENVENVENSSDSAAVSAYGEFANVYLTDLQFDALLKRYPDDWSDRINRLSTYLESHPGKQYENHYAVILSWAIEDNQKQAARDGEALRKAYGFSSTEEMVLALRAAAHLHALEEGGGA